MKTKILMLLIAAVLIFGLITLYKYYNEDTSSLEAAREASGSTLIESEVGVTRFKIYGEENTPTVILIHSFNGFMESWNQNVNALVNAGYRVVVYDLYGRGLSDRPHVKYDLALFRDQLDLVVQRAGVESVYLIGSSFGCVIASDYASHYPDRVKSLVMIGPAGWPQQDEPNALLGVPIVSDFVFHYFGEQILRPKVEAYLFNSSEHYGVLEEWEHFARYPGFTRSALSTLKNSPVLDYISGWKQLELLNKPTLFIWGKQDVSFPFSNTKRVRELIPHAEIMGVDDAAHWVNIEQAEMVNSKIVEFLKTNG